MTLPSPSGIRRSAAVHTPPTPAIAEPSGGSKGFIVELGLAGTGAHGFPVSLPNACYRSSIEIQKSALRLLSGRYLAIADSDEKRLAHHIRPGIIASATH